jgi:hypothetical protein
MDAINAWRQTPLPHTKCGISANLILSTLVVILLTCITAQADDTPVAFRGFRVGMTIPEFKKTPFPQDEARDSKGGSPIPLCSNDQPPKAMISLQHFILRKRMLRLTLLPVAIFSHSQLARFHSFQSWT